MNKRLEERLTDARKDRRFFGEPHPGNDYALVKRPIDYWQLARLLTYLSLSILLYVWTSAKD